METFLAKTHICVHLVFEAKSPPAHKQVLFEVPYLRIILREQSDFIHLKLQNLPLMPLFGEFSTFSTLHADVVLTKTHLFLELLAVTSGSAMNICAEPTAQN